MVERCYEFGPFRLETKGRVLSRHGRPVPLAPKVAETLLLLVRSAGEVIDKKELLEQLWPDTFVEEGSLARNISVLRKALKESSGREYITTVSKRGYRFSFPVSELANSAKVPAITSSKIMLAVLPFENLGGGRDQEFFADGLTEELITHLGRLNPEQLGVIARTSAMRYKRTHKTVPQIGNELRVAYLLEGSVRKSSNHLRIASQLIQVSDQTHLWAESYDVDFSDILTIQASIAQAVARQIEIKLSGPSQTLRSGSINAEAYELCLKGRYFWYKRTEEGLRKGLEYFNQAIARDQRCAAAYDGLCDSYVLLACRGMAPVKETFDRAKAAARKALEIDPAFADAHASIAHIRLHEWDWDGLNEEFQRVIGMNPSRAIVYPWYSEYLVVTGQPELGVVVAKEAEKLDPLSPVMNTSIVTAFYFAQNFQAALDQIHKGMEIDSHHFLPHFRLGQVCIAMKKFDAAIKAMKKAVQLSSRSTETVAGLAQACASAGYKSETKKLLLELDGERSRKYVSPYLMSKLVTCMGNRDQVFACLQQAYEVRDPDLIELKVEPLFDNIRADSRYSKLLSQLAARAKAAKMA